MWVGQTGFVEATSSSLCKGHRFPVEIISHCVWLYRRFSLSLREVEEMMMARSVMVTYETISPARPASTDQLSPQPAVNAASLGFPGLAVRWWGLRWHRNQRWR